MRRRRLPIALVLAAAIAVAGCGSSSSATKKAAATTTTTVPLHPGNNPAIRHLVTVTSCVAAPGGWEASGTAQNPNKQSTAYKITIYFANSQGTIEGTGSTSVSVAASKTGTWKATASLTNPDPKTTCVLSGVA